MTRVLTYKVIEKGYDIYVSEDGGEAVRALHQPEPFIICRVKDEDNTTNYAKSAEAHIALIKQAEADAKAREEEFETHGERIAALETSVAEIEESLREVVETLTGETN